MTFPINLKNLNEKIIKIERKMQRLEQYSHRECMEIADILSSITNDLLKEHDILILGKLQVVMEAVDILACHRLEKTGWVILQLFNRKDVQNVLEEKLMLKVSIFMIKYQ